VGSSASEKEYKTPQGVSWGQRLSIHRGPVPKSNFTILSNDAFNAPLKADALGVWLHLLSKPEDWSIVPKVVQKHFGIGRDALRRIFRELEDHGVMVRQPKRGEDGRVTGWEWQVYEVPQPKDGISGGRSADSLKTRPTVHRPPENPAPGSPSAWKSVPLQRTELLQRTEEDKAQPAPGKKSHLDKTAERIAASLADSEAERASV